MKGYKPKLRMVNWRANQIARQGKQGGGADKEKGENCKTNPTKKFFFTNTKAYKNSQYISWHLKAYRANGCRPPSCYET